ncbi:MAG: hypothetical protein ABH864_06770 [archaeon]
MGDLFGDQNLFGECDVGAARDPGNREEVDGQGVGVVGSSDSGRDVLKGQRHLSFVPSDADLTGQRYIPSVVGPADADGNERPYDQA